MQEEPNTMQPTKVELLRMLKQCGETPSGNVYNYTVAELVRHYLELLSAATEGHTPNHFKCKLCNVIEVAVINCE